MATREQQIAELQKDWDTNPRWRGIVRSYGAADVVRLRGSLPVAHTLARHGACKLWQLLNAEAYVNALGALGSDQAVQQVRAGLKAIYLSGELHGGSSPQSAAALVRSVNHSLLRADQAQWAQGGDETDYLAPIVVDAEAGFGGAPDAFEQTRALIEAGAAAVHLDDQLASARKHAQLNGKVLIPTRAMVEKLRAARLAADVAGTPTVLIARTDADAAMLLSSDVDGDDRPFCTGERTPEGHYRVRGGQQQAIARALAYAPHADLLWCETAKPDLVFAQAFAAAVQARFPGKMLAYHCASWFDWKQNLDDATIARFQQALGAMGYKFQFIAAAGSHALNYGMYKLAHGYVRRQMAAYVDLQEAEFALAAKGYTAVPQPHDADAAYVDALTQTMRSVRPSATAVHGSTQNQPFFDKKVA
jgi:isocitrate lyase